MSISLDPKMQPPGLGKDGPTTAIPNKLDGAIQAVPEGSPQAETEDNAVELDLDEEMWLAKSQAAFDASDDYFNNQVRGKLNNSIKAFHSEHASGSPFATQTKHFTSKIYRPKTRTLITKYQAAATSAFFTNPDIVSIEAENPSSKEETVAAAVMKALLNYRLRKSIDFYRVVLGSFQDAMVQGLCCGYIYWKTQTSTDDNGMDIVHVDKPCIDVIPLENIRFDAAANWADIVETSPYIILLRPMYVIDLKQEMEIGYFNEVDDSTIRGAVSKDGATTRNARNGGKQDPMDKNTKEVDDYEIVLVQEHIHRIDGEDFVWHTLNNKAMLTDPKPIKEVYFHGKRPFVIGTCEIETHTAFTPSQPELFAPVQEEINEIANQRLNNLKLAMNKKFVIKSDSEVDLDALLRNQPGSAVYAQNPKEDVVELSTPDVTQSSYLEQERLDKDFDSLGGQFDPNVGLSGRSGNDRLGTMQMLNSNANAIVEMKLRTFAETYVTPLLRLLAQLEQHYETDDVVLAIAGNNAKAFQKYGVQQITNDMLRKELNIKVNVGLNSTDPTYKLQKFTSVIQQILTLSASPGGKGFDMNEVAQELFGLSGYGDGMRFMNQEHNPQLAMLQQQVQMLSKKVQDQQTKEQVKLQIAREHVASRERVEAAKLNAENAHFLVDHAKEMSAFEHQRDMEQKQHEMEQQQAQQQQAPQGGQPPTK